jgi:site-specific recombinase XerD
MLAGIAQGVKEVGITVGVRGFCMRSLRVSAATDASAHGVAIPKGQGRLGHASISTTRMYDHLINPFRIGQYLGDPSFTASALHHMGF